MPLVSKPAFLNPAVRFGIQKAIEAGLAFLAARSTRNTTNSTAALEINASSFEPGADRQKPWIATRQLTKEEVDELCPKRKLVQEYLDEAAANHRPEDYPTAAARGTAIHVEVAQRINGPGRTYKNPQDPNFRAEASFINSELVDWGTKDSKRFDALENSGKSTVCVHDGKTGNATLSFAEMTKLMSQVHSFYPGTQRLIITEVRPSK